MSASLSHRSPPPLAIAAALALAACADEAPLAPRPPSGVATLAAPAESNMALAELRRATAAYHNVNAAIADGFIQVVECEDRPGEGPVGIVYGNLDRLDGILDPSQPEALLYEPDKDGRLRLVGAELAIPFPLWTAEDPPEFLGVPFQREEELGVFGLHIWIWRHNPDGMFAIRNPRVSCQSES